MIAGKKTAGMVLAAHFGARLIDVFKMSDAAVTAGLIDSVTGDKGTVLLPLDAANKPYLDGIYATNLTAGYGLTGTLPVAAATLTLAALCRQVETNTLNYENEVMVGVSGGQYRGTRLKAGSPQVMAVRADLTLSSAAFTSTIAASEVYSVIATYTIDAGYTGRAKNAGAIMSTVTSTANSAAQADIVIGKRLSGTYTTKFAVAEIIAINGTIDAADTTIIDQYFNF